MRRQIVWLTLLSCCAADTRQPPAKADSPPASPPPAAVVTSARAAPKRAPPALTGTEKVEVIADGFVFVEGPSWWRGELFFSDILADTIYRWSETAGARVFRRPSGMANGLARDREGRLIAAEHQTRRLSRTLGDGSVVILAERFEGRRLNSPNDIAVRADGTVYFTDPPYGIGNEPDELEFMGVFRLSPDGMLTAEWKGPAAARPNGVALSPDERTLFVSDSEAARLDRFTVATDGRLGPLRPFAKTAPIPDGLAVDAAGRIYVATSTGIEVFDADGGRLGRIEVPEPVTNCAFGGAQRRTLFITGRRAVYRVRLATAGR